MANILDHRALIISAFTASNAAAIGNQALIEQLTSPTTALQRCDFDTAETLETTIGRIADLEAIPTQLDPSYHTRNHQLAELSLSQDHFKQQVTQLKKRYDSHRIGCIIGTTTSSMYETEKAYQNRNLKTGALDPQFCYEHQLNLYSTTDYIKQILGLKGPGFTICTACSSSAKAFISAARLMQAGIIDACIVGGVDSLSLTTLFGFHSLSLLSTSPMQPYDCQRSGLSLGEGAGFAIVERQSQAQDVQGYLLGYGESMDAHHISTPHPEGNGARLAMQNALNKAQLTPQAIDYINLHGTASRSNDESEGKAILTLFGEQTPPCSSTKGLMGHTLGTAGITEAIISLLAIQQHWLPATTNTLNPDPEIPIQLVTKPGPKTIKTAMSNSFGFGGSNACLILGAASC